VTCEPDHQDADSFTNGSFSVEWGDFERYSSSFIRRFPQRDARLRLLVGAMSCLFSTRAFVSVHGECVGRARVTRVCLILHRVAGGSTRRVAASARPTDFTETGGVLDSGHIPRRSAMGYSALAVGLGLFGTAPGGARAEEAASTEETVVAENSVGSPPNPVVDESDTPKARDTSRVGNVTLTRYVDETSGYSIAVPNDWVRDQPMLNTPEFHPVSEYGGRRFRIEVSSVGRVPGGGAALVSLVNSEMESLTGAGFESAANFAQVEATKFAPIKGTPAAIVAAKGPGGAVSEIIDSSVSSDGKYYNYEFRTDSIYPLRFFGVAAIGPGQTGSARKLGRRDIVKVTCQVPEKDASEFDYDLLRQIARSFRVDAFEG
jgi:hypothetical protein